MCEHCGSDRTNSPFPDCDCLRRNAPVTTREWATMIVGFGLLLFVIVTSLT